ncbi:hypothetical protein HDV03_005535 [Kappamyces sp. JEL0829]|nr:hypothetical protein HDV03_005535 [Kappamyces sp. JEL0829]
MSVAITVVNSVALATLSAACFSVGYFLYFLAVRQCQWAFGKYIQIVAHLSSLLMMLFKMAEIAFTLAQDSCPGPVVTVFSVCNFIYSLSASLYYLEVLVCIQVTTKRKCLKGQAIRLYQKLEIALHFACNFASVFRGTLYVDYHTNNFWSNWAQGGPFIVVQSALLGMVVASLVFNALNHLTLGLDGESDKRAEGRSRRLKHWLLGFAFLELLTFASFIINGSLVGGIYGVPTSGIATALAGLEICIFTVIFEKTVQMFSERQTTPSQPASVAGVSFSSRPGSEAKDY